MKKYILLVFVVIIALAGYFLLARGQHKLAANAAVSVTDSTGAKVHIPAAPKRIVFLNASNLEIFAQAIKNFGRRGYARLKGIILNAKNIENEQELVAKAAAEIGTEVVQYVPRSGDIQIAENQGGTVSEFVKDSPMVQVYNELAEHVLAMSEDEEE